MLPHPRLLAIVHQAHSRTGRVGRLLEQQGCLIDRCCPNHGDKLPDPRHYDGVLMFGGPMSANDDLTLPGIAAELRWLDDVLAARTPFLGVCLGAQLIARALGAKVWLHPDGQAEIGYARIVPTDAGRDYFPEPLHVYQWHREGFDLPKDALLLARGELFANQAFVYDEHVYGLQFHPEVTLEMKRVWTVKAAERLKLPGAQPREQHIDRHPLYDPALGHWTERFLGRWLARIEQPLPATAAAE